MGLLKAMPGTPMELVAMLREAANDIESHERNAICAAVVLGYEDGPDTAEITHTWWRSRDDQSYLRQSYLYTRLMATANELLDLMQENRRAFE